MWPWRRDRTRSGYLPGGISWWCVRNRLHVFRIFSGQRVTCGPGHVVMLFSWSVGLIIWIITGILTGNTSSTPLSTYVVYILLQPKKDNHCNSRQTEHTCIQGLRTTIGKITHQCSCYLCFTSWNSRQCQQMSDCFKNKANSKREEHSGTVSTCMNIPSLTF